MDVLLTQVLADKTKRNKLSANKVVYNVSSGESW